MKGWFDMLFGRRHHTDPKAKEKRESQHQLLATEGVLSELEKRVANIERERRIVARDHSTRKPEPE